MEAADSLRAIPQMTYLPKLKLNLEPSFALPGKNLDGQPFVRCG